MLLLQVQFPGAARDLSPSVNFQCRLSYGVNTPVNCSQRLSLVDYENAKTSSMHHRLGSATLLQLAFPGKNDLNFLWEKSHWDNTVV